MNYQMNFDETDKNLFFTANLIKDFCIIIKNRSTLPYSSFGGGVMRAPVVNEVFRRETEWIASAAEIKKNNSLEWETQFFQRTNGQIPA